MCFLSCALLRGYLPQLPECRQQCTQRHYPGHPLCLDSSQVCLRGQLISLQFYNYSKVLFAVVFRDSALGLYGNQFNGTIPSTVSSLAGAVFMYLGNNHLVGTIPATMSALTSLQYVKLCCDCLHVVESCKVYKDCRRIARSCAYFAMLPYHPWFFCPPPPPSSGSWGCHRTT